MANFLTRPALRVLGVISLLFAPACGPSDDPPSSAAASPAQPSASKAERPPQSKSEGSLEAAPKPIPVSQDRAVLFERFEKAPGDVAARRALTSLLQSGDRPRIAKLLDGARWNQPGFFQYVRWMHTVDASILAPPVQGALEAVARGHEKQPVREWAVKALSRAAHPSPGFFAEMVGKGSGEALRAQVGRADDGFDILLKATASADSKARDAAYDVLIALAKLGKPLSADQRAQLVNQVSLDLASGPKAKPWRYLRALYQLMMTRPKLPTPIEGRLLTALEPYCLSTKDSKPWWDALLTVKRLGTPKSEAIIKAAIASVPSQKGRRIMADRLSIE